MWSGWLRGSICRVLLFWDGFVFPKPLSPKRGSTFLPPLHAATLIFAVDWGLVLAVGLVFVAPLGLALWLIENEGLKVAATTFWGFFGLLALAEILDFLRAQKW